MVPMADGRGVRWDRDRGVGWGTGGNWGEREGKGGKECWERTNAVLLRAQCGNVLMHAFLTYIKLSSKSRIRLHVEHG